MKIIALLPLVLVAGCVTIDYSHRAREPAEEITWRYVDYPNTECQIVMAIPAPGPVPKECTESPDAQPLIIGACVVFPDAHCMADPDKSHFRRAVGILPKSEEYQSGRITKHEQGHIDGYNHKE